MTLRSLQQYGKHFQHKVLNALITEKNFLLNVRDVLKEEYFDSDAHKWIINQITSYFDKHHTAPTYEVLKIEVLKIENEVSRIAVKNELKTSYSESTEDIEYVKEEFTSFCRNQEIKQAILNSTDLLEKGDYDGILSLMERATKAGLDKNIGHEYNKDLEDRYRPESRKVIPTPWEHINAITGGGFGNGDLVTILAGPGAGKCVDGETEVDIEYEEYGIEMKNNAGNCYTFWFSSIEKFNIDDKILYGYEIADFFIK